MNQKTQPKTLFDQINPNQIQNQIGLKVNTGLFKRTIQQLNKSLQENSQNSCLLNQRAIFHHETGQKKQAIRDFNLSIESNHLNFMAYFNIFSVYLQDKRQEEAFDQLCCSLSCLYLIRAKCQRRQLDAQKAIIYANNNIQAHVLKCLMFMQKKDKTNLKLALDQMNLTLQILTQNKLGDRCRKLSALKDLILKDMQKKELYQTIIHAKNTQHLQNTNKSDKTKNAAQEVQKCSHRLKNSYKGQLNLNQQIYQRLVEFNQVFSQLLNSQFQIVSTTKKIQSYKKVNNSIFQLSRLYANSRQLNSTNQKVGQSQYIKQLQKVYIKQKAVNSQNNQLQTEKQLANQNEVQYNQQNQNGPLIQSHQRVNQHSVDLDKQALQLEASEQNSNSQEQYNQKLYNKNSLDSSRSIEDQKKVMSEQNIDISNMYIKGLNILQNSQNNKRPAMNTKSFLNISLKSSVQSSMCESNQVVNLYKDVQKVGKKRKLQFKIQSFVFTQNYSSKKKAKKYLYCLGQYNYENKQKNQFKTSCQKLNEGRCLWDQVYPPVKLAKSSQFFKILVYSKNYFSEFDQFIGSGQKQIVLTGQNEIQIVNPNLEVVGILSIKVYLI